MKRKIFSVTMVLILACSFFSVALPVSAGTLSWTPEPIPSAVNSVVVAGSDVVDFAVGSDGTTVWAVDGALNIYKSTDGGAKWTAITKPAGVDTQITSVAIAPDDVSVVAIVADSNEVYVTTNGGATWSSLGTVQEAGMGAAANLYDIAISHEEIGIRYIAVAGDEALATYGAGNVWYFNLGSSVPAWKETNTKAGFDTTAGEGAFAVAFSPNFVLDKVMLAVTGPNGMAGGDTAAKFQMFSFNALIWNASAGFGDYPVTVDTLAAGSSLLSASIALSANYNGADPGSRLAFVGVASNDASAKGSLNRLTDTALMVLRDFTNIHSVAYDGTYLVAGDYDSNNVYRTNFETTPGVDVYATSTEEGPGGTSSVIVAWIGDNVVAGTSGTGSCFAVSTDSGQTFSDTSLIGTEVADFAVGSDGTTVWVVDGVGQNIEKSIDSGANWTSITEPAGVDTQITSVAIAPDDVYVVAIVADSNEVYITTNGGFTWSGLGVPLDASVAGAVAAANLYDMAISPAVNGVRHVAVAGDEVLATAGAGNVWYFNLGAAVPAWKETNSKTGFDATADEGAFAVAFSPNFVLDKVMLAVTGPNGAAGGDTLVKLQVFSHNSRMWNEAAGIQMPVTVDTLAPGSTVTRADIAVPSTYLGADPDTRKVFVGVASNDAVNRGSLNRVTKGNMVLQDNINIHSVAYNTAADRLVAGAGDSNIVYRSSNPMATPGMKIYPTSAYKRPGGIGRVVVNFAGDNVVAGTIGNESAFSVSQDNGKTFNDISLIDTALTNITDVMPSADGSKVYMVTDDTADMSVWLKDGRWQRVLSVVGDTGFMVRTAPESFNAVYMAQQSGAIIYYSDNGGKTGWSLRVAPVPIHDLAVESANVAYSLSSTGNVYKSTNSGFTWSTPKNTNLGAGYMIRSLSPDNLIVGGTEANATVSYSTDGGTTWTRIGPSMMPGNVQVTAEGLAEGDNIYAGTSALNDRVYRWTIGTNTTAWTKISASDLLSQDIDGDYMPESFGVSGIELMGGVLYVLANDAEVAPLSSDSMVARNLKPSLVYSTARLIWSTMRSTGKLYNVAPQALRLSSDGIKIWAIDTASARLYSYTDTLATTWPTLLNPEDGATIKVNAITGRAYDVTFTWERPSQATGYDLQVAFDSSFTQLKLSENNWGTTSSTVSATIGPYSAAPVSGATPDWQPGTTCYWRARAREPVRSPWSEVRSFTVEGISEGVGVSIDGPDTVSEYQDFTATVDIGEVVDLNSARYEITFDPSVLKLNNVTDGQIDSTAMPVTELTQISPGRYGVFQSLMFDKVRGSGYLSVLHFRVVGSVNQSTTIGLANGILTGWDADIPATWTGDTVSVSQALQSIEILPAKPTVVPDRTVQFTATGTYPDTSTADLTMVATWTSSDQKVATIGTNTGLAYSLAKGQTTITATIGDISDTTNLTVTTLVPDLLVLDKYEEWVNEADGTYRVYYTIRNTGNAEVAAGHYVGLTVDGVDVEQKAVAVALAPDAVHSDSFDTVINLSGSSDEVKVCADINSQVDELVETNNCLTNPWPAVGVLVSINAPDGVPENYDFTATVNISHVNSLDAANYDISFNSTALRLDNVTSGNINGTVIPVGVWNENPPGSGVYTIVQNIPAFTGISGSGYLSILHFHVTGSLGDSITISLSNGKLSNNLAQEIAAAWTGDLVEISVIPGDANGDDAVNSLDITKVERTIAGLDSSQPGADANLDGSVNALDITKVERIIAGLD